MTVEELKEELENYGEDMEVIYSINGKDIYDIDAIGHCELENGQKCVILI